MREHKANYGDLTADAIAAAESIGARQHAARFKEFAHIGLGDDLTLDPDARDARIDSTSETQHDALGALDEPFYALPSINEYLTAYVELQPGQFCRD